MGRHTKNALRILRRPFEWLGIALAFILIVPLPRRAMLLFCDMIMRAMFFFDRRGRKLAARNLRIVLGRALPAKAERKILLRSYRNMGRSVGYALWSCVFAKTRCRKAGVMGAEGKAFLAEHKPAITVSGHLGCWEILSQLAYLEGHDMMSVAKDIGSSAMTGLLMKARRSIGQEIVPAAGAFRPLMAGLKAGKSLGLLVDQVVKPKDGGIWVRFFGRPVPVSAAPAFFAAKGKAPVVMAWSRPLKDGRWSCDTLATMKPDEARDIWGFTQRTIRILERVIRRHPSCWILNYRYFRKTPTPEELAKLERLEARSRKEGGSS